MAWSKKKMLTVAGLVAAGGIGAITIGSKIGMFSKEKKSEKKYVAPSKPAVKTNDSATLLPSNHAEEKQPIESRESASNESWMVSTEEENVGYYSGSGDRTFDGARATEKCPKYLVEPYIFNLDQEVYNNSKNKQLGFIIDKGALENIFQNEKRTNKRAAEMLLRKKIRKLNRLKKIKTRNKNFRKASAVKKSHKLNKTNNNSTTIANPLILRNNEKDTDVKKVEELDSNEEYSSKQSSSEKSHESKQERAKEDVQLETENQVDSEIREKVKTDWGLKLRGYNVLKWFNFIIKYAKFKQSTAINPLHNHHLNSSVKDCFAVEEESKNKHESSTNDLYSDKNQENRFEIHHKNKIKKDFINNSNNPNNCKNDYSNSEDSENSSASSSILPISNSEERKFKYIQEVNELISNRYGVQTDSRSQENTLDKDLMGSNYGWDEYWPLYEENDYNFNIEDFDLANGYNSTTQKKILNLSQNTQSQNLIDMNNNNDIFYSETEADYEQCELSEKKRLSSLSNSDTDDLSSETLECLLKKSLTPMNEEYYKFYFEKKKPKKPEKSDNTTEEIKEQENLGNTTEEIKKSENLGNTTEEIKKSENLDDNSNNSNLKEIQ
ncbi:hypothetical protein NEPAR06_2043 [Nematocida parisii]|nr:hypothetical protein NEPAR06_2043 [Nematocida parisii]